MNNITTQDFGDFRFYDAMLTIDNEKFMQKLQKTYYELKTFHIGNGRWSEENTKNNITYDPSYFLEDHNIFTFPMEELHEIFSNIKKSLVMACEENDIDIKKQQYYIHGWLNYFPGKMHQSKEYEDLYWHDHGDNLNEFHGYYAVNAEPSITHYRTNGEKLDRENKNGRLVLARTGVDHAVGKWNFDTPRISIAYNLFPLEHLLISKFEYRTPFIPVI